MGEEARKKRKEKISSSFSFFLQEKESEEKERKRKKRKNENLLKEKKKSAMTQYFGLTTFLAIRKCSTIGGSLAKSGVGMLNV